MNASTAEAIQIFGSGGRKVLALHCTLGHGGNWRRLASALPQTTRVIAPDLPGHGKAAPCAEGADLHDQCTALARAVLTEPMDVISHSFGATVALRLALENPQYVRSLTLIEPVLLVAAACDAPAVMATYLEEAKPFEAALATGDYVTAARLFNRVWGDGTAWRDFSEQAQRYMSDRISLVPRQAPAIVGDTPGFMRKGRLEGLDIPTLLIEGTQTEPVIGAIHDALMARLPKVRRASIPAAGHMCPLTHPVEVATEITALFEVT
ncbi:MAG: alpha/beta fold hydrolase [Roseobacter sp.]